MNLHEPVTTVEKENLHGAPAAATRLEVGGRILWRNGVPFESGPAVLLLTNGRITAVFEKNSISENWERTVQRVFPDAVRVCYDDAVATVGLLEGHAHLFLKEGQDTRAHAGDHARDYINAGVMWVRDCGDPAAVNLQVRDEFRSHHSYLQIRACGAAIHRRKRYGKQLGLAVDDDEGLLAAVQERIAAGVDDVKIILSGIVRFEKEEVPGDPQFSLEALRRAVDAAHSADRRVAVHASGDKAVALAAQAGVNTVEHAYFVSEKTLELMAAANTTWLPTLAPVYAQLRDAEKFGHSHVTRAALKRILEGHARSIEKAARLKVPIAAGSDAGSPGVGHGSGAALEFRLLNEHGLTLHQAFAASSSAGATATGFLPNGVETGEPADFLILQHSPLRNNTAFSRILARVSGGTISPAERERRSL